MSMIYFVLCLNSNYGRRHGGSGRGLHRGAGRKRRFANRSPRRMRNSEGMRERQLGRATSVSNNNHYNNFGRNSVAVNGSWSGAAGWGLMGGFGLGMMMGLMIDENRNGRQSTNSSNTTIINNYHQDAEKDNYKKALSIVRDQIKKINKLVEKLEIEEKKLEEKNESFYIKEYFSPYAKISILTTKSNELYNDGKKDKVETTIFQGNQEIYKMIKLIQSEVKNGLDMMYKNMQKENESEVKNVREELIRSLKFLNYSTVEISKKIM